jgi:acetoacetate decarboxylase
LRALVPEPLEVHEPIVKYEFIRMPDSTGFVITPKSAK